MKIAPFSLLAQRRRALPGAAAPEDSIPRIEAELLGLEETDLSPRARARLNGLLDDIDRMQEETERLAARVRELEALADTDPLADVMNRRAFMRELSRALAFAIRHGGPVCVLYLDFDGFKAINDRHGHRAGDAAIVHAAKILKANLRETDAVGRMGGDEFAVVMVKADREQARAKADQLKAMIRAEPVVFECVTIRLDVSIGVYETTPLDTPDTAVRAADEAMFNVKNAETRSSASEAPNAAGHALEETRSPTR